MGPVSTRRGAKTVASAPVAIFSHFLSGSDFPAPEVDRAGSSDLDAAAAVMAMSIVDDEEDVMASESTASTVTTADVLKPVSGNEGVQIRMTPLVICLDHAEEPGLGSVC